MLCIYSMAKCVYVINQNSDMSCSAKSASCPCHVPVPQDSGNCGWTGNTAGRHWET